DRVVLARPNSLAEILTHLRRVDVEGGREFDVAHVIAAEVHVHQPGHKLFRVGVAVIVDALDERRGAVTDADDRYPDLVLLVARLTVAGGRAVALLNAHLVKFPLWRSGETTPRGAPGDINRVRA